MFCFGRAVLAFAIARLSMQLAAYGVRVEVSPVQKVMSLLGELEIKLTKDGQEEQASYKAYMEWCSHGKSDKTYELKTAKSDIEDLQAQISKASADLESFSSKMDDLAQEINVNSADLKAAETVRDKEHSEFVSVEKELIDTLDTLKRAINILDRKMHDSALMQAHIDTKDTQSIIRALTAVVDAAGLSLQDRSRLVGLVQSSQEEDDDELRAAPTPEAYKSHSKGIIEVLEDLMRKASEQLDQARREETNARHNFELMKQTLTEEIKTDNEDLSQTKSLKHEATERKATAEGDLTETKKVLESAETVLKTIDADCAQKSSDHEASVKSTDEALEALAKAKKVLADNVGGASKHVYSESFLQVRMLNDGAGAGGSHLQTEAELVNFEVVTYVRKLAREQKSADLAQLATRISAAMQTGSDQGDDPFAKVKGMISDMIERLMKQAGEDAKLKMYCDKEMAETKKKTAELKYDVEKLTGKIDQNTADVTRLKDEIATLNRDLAEMAKAQSEADALRAEESKVYNVAKADLEQGLSGVRMAMKILRDYFTESPAAAAVFVQQPAGSGAVTGIISMLEVVESDFGRELAMKEMNEETHASAYEKMTMKNKIDKAVKQKDVEYKTKTIKNEQRSASELSSDLDSTQTELDSVLESTKTIRGMCEAKPLSYTEKQARRQAEIDGLKEALKILEGEGAFLQHQLRRSKRGMSLLRGAAVSKQRNNQK